MQIMFPSCGPKMIVPRQASVRPRGLSPVSGAALPLEDLVAERIASAREGLLEIVGPPGSGKTVALQHLAQVFASNPNVGFLECASERPKRTLATRLRDWVVYALQVSHPEAPSKDQIRLAPWGADEWIEYLLAQHKSACASVMSRLRAAGDTAFLGGNPALWCIALDQMAADSALTSPRQALARFLDGRLTNPKLSTAAAACSIAELVHRTCPLELLNEKLIPLDGGAEAARLLRHRPIQLLIAAQQIVHDVQTKSTCAYFRLRFPRELIECTAKAVASQSHAIAKLQAWFVKPELQANAASILHASNIGWKPPGAIPWTECRLTGAYLAGAQWSGIAMRQANLCEADLSGADLRVADLNGARADKVNLVGADLRGALLLSFHAIGAEMARARLENADACEAMFRGADLEQAKFDGANLSEAVFAKSNLSGVSFRGATMNCANLVGAKLTCADFTGADLTGAQLVELKMSEATFTGAVFVEAGLVGADLEGMDLSEADFSRAILTKALLTGSSMPRARFDGARLDNAGLADVDWPGVSLRGADLRGASFHLGSSRNGLVGSPIACEGSRTGFYTDDYTEQDFKAPEEIRKANLCYADLRGADITDVDFYLVDLRHAKYDPEQEAHLRRCGAILQARAGEEIE
jgi:uncharacterized protein YjbI with pentapeptide repeats